MIDKDKISMALANAFILSEINGVKVEDIKEGDGKILMEIYFSVPETISHPIVANDKEQMDVFKFMVLRTTVKNSDLLHMVSAIDPEAEHFFIEKMGDIFKFYGKVRKGEHWGQEQYDKKYQELIGKAKESAKEKELRENGYQEV